MTLERSTVTTSIAGLDRVLGGGVTVLERSPGTGLCAVVLIRGGAGTGKTILACHVAASVARQWACDALVACVELLPTELEAQLSGFDATRPMLPVRVKGPPGGDAPRFFANIVPISPADPVVSLGHELDACVASIEHRGGLPRVVVLDAASAGYGFAADSVRTAADAVAKLAPHRGLFLVITEESAGGDDGPPWGFVSDVVLDLRMAPRASFDRPDGTSPFARRGAPSCGPEEIVRTITVVKNRFGEAFCGPHELAFGVGTISVL